MKNFKPITIVAALLVSAFTFYQCTNDEELFSGFPVVEDFQNFQEIHDTLTLNDTVRLTIDDPTIQNILTGDQGIRLIFPANSCTIGGGGTPVAPFTVNLIEIFKRGDVVAHNLQTFTNNKALISGGIFWIRVKDANGVELTMNGVQAILPYQTDAASYQNLMQYFVKSNQANFSWNPGTSTVSFDETAGTNGEFAISEINSGWNSSSAENQFTGQTPTQFSVKVSEFSTPSDYNNTKVFFSLDEFTTVEALTTPSIGGLQTRPNSVATGATGKIIAISLIEGALQFASQDVTIEGNDEFVLEVAPGTVEELENLLGSLD